MGVSQSASAYKHTSLDKPADCPSTLVMQTKHVPVLFSKTMIKRLGSVQFEAGVGIHVVLFRPLVEMGGSNYLKVSIWSMWLTACIKHSYQTFCYTSSSSGPLSPLRFLGQPSRCKGGTVSRFMNLPSCSWLDLKLFTRTLTPLSEKTSVVTMKTAPNNLF